MLKKLSLSEKQKPSKMVRCFAPLADRFIHILGFRISLLSLLSYLLDWTLYTVIAVVGGVLAFAQPLQQDFDLQNRALWHTFYPEPILMIPVWALTIMSAVIPLVLGFFFSIISVWSWPTRLWDYHIYALGLLGSLASQLLVVTLLKNAAGKPRPDFIQRCAPMPFVPAPNTLANIIVCTNPNLLVLWDGYKSFPSEHAAAMFTSATFHFLFNAARNRIFDGRGISWRLLLCGAPILAAAQVSSLSLSDHRNFLSDVVVGAGIGVFIGWVFYHLYFPSIFDIENGGKAYPPRRFGIPFLFGRDTQFYPFEHDMVIPKSVDAFNVATMPAHAQNIQPCAVPAPVVVAPAPKVVVNIKKPHTHEVHAPVGYMSKSTEFPQKHGLPTMPLTPLASKYPHEH